MKTPVITTILTIASLFAYSQDFSPPHLLTLKFTPTSMLNLHVPTIMSGMEISLGKRISTEFEYGFQYLFPKEGARQNWHYHKLKGGPRLSFPTNDKMTAFVKAEAFAVYQTYQKTNSIVEIENGDLYSYDTSAIDRKTRGFCLGAGIIVSKKQFSLELYFGGGWKWVSIYHELKDAKALYDFRRYSTWLNSPMDEKQGYWSLPHVDLGLKICLPLFEVRQTKADSN